MQVFPADAFAESAGVGVHAASPPYSNDPALFARTLKALGVGCARDEILGTDPAAHNALLAAVPGLRLHLLASPMFCTPQQVVSYVRAVGRENVSAIEGQNEGDSPWALSQPQMKPDWAARVVAYQKALYPAVKAAFPDLPVVSPTVLDYRPQDMAAIKGAAPYCDAVAIHAYNQNSTQPESAAPYSALSWYLANFRDPWKPGAPVLVTECGYTTPPGGRVSAEAAGKYIPRLLLQNLAAGVERTFVYELMNSGTDVNDTESNYGLTLWDTRPKPAYASTRNLLALLADPGPAFTPEPVLVTVVDAPETVKGVVFQRRDRSYQVALWDAVASAPAPVSPRPTRIAMNRPFRSAAYAVANTGTAYASVKTDGRGAIVPVSDLVTVVHLVP